MTTAAATQPPNRPASEAPEAVQDVPGLKRRKDEGMKIWRAVAEGPAVGKHEIYCL